MEMILHKPKDVGCVLFAACLRKVDSEDGMREMR